MEVLTKSSPAVIFSMYIPLIVWLLYYSYTSKGFSAGQVAGVYIGGIFFWTLFEYFAHRFLFHMTPSSAWGQRVAYILHGNHHEFPRDKTRLLMPPAPSLIMAGIVFSIFFLVAGNWTLMFFPGFISGYLLYGSLHYSIHAFNPPFKWMKPLWRNHHLHHYKDDHRGFGVTSTFWDRVFGTMYDLKKEVEDKERVKELMYES
jgi:sterol desaturase/sphingolipid hydroxylase (fatty acid hydroxylase superfamily)